MTMRKYLLVTLLLPLASFSQTVPYRQYKPGEASRYILTSEVYRNEKFAGKTISVAELRAVKDSAFVSEEIKWLSKVSFTAKDTVNLDSIAQKVKPYKISLSPNGNVPLPKLTIPEMVGDITDLNTFFVAIAPALNCQKLTKSNRDFKNAETRQGNFTDSLVILYGTDCIEITQHLVEVTNKYVLVRTDFTPPSSFCLKPLLDTMAVSLFGHPNNFQMIQKDAADKVNVFWGVESFSITSKINRKNGKLQEAAMTNVLDLRMRYNSSKDLKDYAVEMPISIKRKLKLELLKK